MEQFVPSQSATRRCARRRSRRRCPPTRGPERGRQANRTHVARSGVLTRTPNGRYSVGERTCQPCKPRSMSRRWCAPFSERVITHPFHRAFSGFWVVVDAGTSKLHRRQPIEHPRDQFCCHLDLADNASHFFAAVPRQLDTPISIYWRERRAFLDQREQHAARAGPTGHRGNGSRTQAPTRPRRSAGISRNVRPHHRPTMPPDSDYRLRVAHWQDRRDRRVRR